MTTPFWEHKSLQEMTEEEWESLCDGCGKCCLVKIIDTETDELHFTNIGCDLLNSKTCRCSDYPNRFEKIDDCFKVTLDDQESFGWLPKSCAYRRLAEGRGLPSWHPLVSGSASAMHAGGHSIRNKIIYEVTASPDLDLHICTWPLNDE